MRFLATFFRAFYSAALYRRVLMAERGYGVAYSLFLYLFVAVLGASCILLTMRAPLQEMLPQLADVTPAEWGLIFVGGLLLRILMLVLLAVSARLIAWRFKIPMNYATAFRVAGVAYTPVTVLDATMFCLTLHPVSVLLLFAGGVAMLLAVLHSTR